MSQNVNKKFKDDFQSEVTLLLMREVVLMETFEKTIVQSQIKRQEVKTENEKNKIQVSSLNPSYLREYLLKFLSFSPMQT